MKKLFLVICTIIPLGTFAQQVRYIQTAQNITAPESQDVIIPAPQQDVIIPKSQNVTVPVSVYQSQNQSENQSEPAPQAPIRRDGLYRDSLKTSQRGAINTTFIKNRYRDNWFISIGGGLAWLGSEESSLVDFTKTLQPTLAFSIGKWVTPVVGARINVTAAKLQGFASWMTGRTSSAPADFTGFGNWYAGKKYMDPLEYTDKRTFTNTYLDATLGGDVSRYIEEAFLDMSSPRSVSGGISGYDYFLNYAAGSLDLMLNFTNFVDKYRPKRVVNINLLAGVGYAHTFKEEKWVDGVDARGNIKPGKHNAAGQVERTKSAVNSIAARLGMEIAFRLGNNVTFNIEPQALFVPEFFDRRVGDGNTMDIVANGLAGFTFKFNEANFYEPLVADAQQIVYLNNEPSKDYCDDLMARLNRLEELLQQPPAPRAGARDIVEELEHLKVVVYFIIDKWEVRQSEMYKLDEIAKFMRKYPRVRVSIEGYADVQTAYPAYNMKLSERRANEVARILTAKYGIERSRLKVTQYGDTVQPFSVNELNRAVIAFDIPE